MKVFRLLTFALLGSQFCSAQEPPIAGTWQFAQQSFKYLGIGSDRIPDDISSAIDPITISSANTFSGGGEMGRWSFSDDYLLAISSGGIDTLAVSETGDSFVFADCEFESTGGGDFSQKCNLNFAVKEPTTPTTAAQMVGEWVLFRQELEYRDTPSGGGMVRTLREVGQNRINLDFTDGGIFTVQIITNTGNPDEEGTMGFGDWEMSGGVLETTFLGDVETRSHFSSGADFLVHTEEESAMDGADTLYSSKLEVWLKKPTSLTTGDIVGRWGVAGTTIDLDVVGGGQSLHKIGFEESVLDFRADGTGTRRIIDNGEAAALGLTEDFTWVLNGLEMDVTASSGSFRFVITAEKDFAVMQQFEADAGEETESFDFFGLAKLPDAPGFAGMPMSLTLLDAEGGMKPVLTTPTLTGVRYQVETGNNLSGWQGFGPIMTGTGGVISSNLPVITGSENFFRWKILPPPS